MASADKVLNEVIEQFETKARSFGKEGELIALAKLAFVAGESQRNGEEVPDDQVKVVLHPSRLHGLVD